VIVCDDMLLVREGIARTLVSRGVEVVADRSSAEGLERLVEAHQPDVVILDIRMPPTFTDEGLTAAAAVRRAFPQVAVLVLSQFLEPVYAMRLLEEAPERVGYLLKDRVMDIATVLDALRRIVDGETVIDPTIVSKLMGRRRRPGFLNLLTPRELEVLALVAEGLSNSAIGHRLRIGERTVEAHIAQIFAKLGLDVSAATHRRVLAALTYLRTTG
jgi:DNA-binding NarL/FixJ family response regulator